MVCESPPTLEPGAANGSTMIPAHVLPQLPSDLEVDLAWFPDRPAQPSPAVLDRCDTVVRLRLRAAPTALAAQPLTRLPRATWQRAGADADVLRLAERADVVYLHGLHTFSCATRLPVPFLAHEVDPWSHYWAERGAGAGALHGAYDALQARRARRLEHTAGAAAARYVVVNAADADRLGRELGRPVDAVPNGVELERLTPRDGQQVDSELLAFVGTLDYPPNVAAVEELCRDVLPLVREQRPSVRLVVAGRRPTAAVRALQGEGVLVLGQVEDVRDVFAQALVAVYPGALGRGTKNTVLEALAVGCPVVCSPEAARGAPEGEFLRLGRDAGELAAHVLGLLADPPRVQKAGAAAARAAHALPGWDAVAQTYAGLLRASAALPGSAAPTLD